MKIRNRRKYGRNFRENVLIGNISNNLCTSYVPILHECMMPLGQIGRYKYQFQNWKRNGRYGNKNKSFVDSIDIFPCENKRI